ncbi:MAG: hypothetical protein KC621_22610 [Myxococcales bacterium]|nr:hypothetical protein [Myxococcales bacterium]
MWMVWIAVAQAGPEHVEKVAARHDAKEIELLQRSTSRPGVQQQAVADYLDRYHHLDTRPVRRIEAWGAQIQGPWPSMPETDDVQDRPLAIPAR